MPEVIVVGTSGWQYRDWRGPVYPRSLPQRLWLESYAGRFPTVELNNSFYRLPERSTFEDWAARTPEAFRFSVKMSRYLTHIRRLREPAEPVARFLERAGGLGAKLGPVLLQLPPTLTADLDRLDAVLACFPTGSQIVVEPRHRSWWTEDLRHLLRRHGAALCWADRRGRPVTPLWRTADFGYLRLHEGRAAPRPRYGRAALVTWLDRLAECPADATFYVYFNNDPGAAAVINAEEFARLAQARGTPVLLP